MASHRDKESSPAISLDEEIELDEILPTSFAPRASGAVEVTARTPDGSITVAPASRAARLAMPPPGAPRADTLRPDTSRPDSQPPRLDTPSHAANPIAELPVIAYYSRFALLGRLAFGGMAEIFLARETSSNASRHLVVKRILPHVADDEGFVSMFLDEARLAMRLQHPNICPVYEFGEAAGTWFIAMEWVDGVPLGKLIRKARATGGIPIPVAVRVIAQIAEALHYAHRARDESGAPLGLVHRDVSPQNIMIGYHGSVKLLDFGVAKASSQATRTQAGIVKGKLAYMAPEQCRGDEIDGRADVFALGVCLYEALAGRPLYHRQNDFETLKAVLDDPVPSARALRPAVPADLDAIVQRALAKSAEVRWQSAGELQEALEQWLTDHRERVNATRTAQYLEGLYAEEIARGPALTTGPVAPGSARGDSLMPGGGSVPSLPAAGAATETPQPASGPSSGVVLAGAGLAASLPPAAPDAARTDAVTARPGARPQPAKPLWIALAAALALLLVAGLAAGGWWLHGRDATDARAAVSAAPAPAAPAPASPAPAAPIAAPAALIAAPAAPAPAAPAPAAPAAPAPAAPIAAPASSDAAGAPREPSRGRAQGTLALNTRPWSKAYVGGRLLGTTPFGSVSVPAGTVTLRLVDRDGNTHRRTVRVEAGREASAFFDLSTGGE